MKEEIKKWFDQASSDLDAAQDSITSRHFDWACFQAQQAAEKGLKALYLQTKGQFRKIHDLNFLGKELGLNGKETFETIYIALLGKDHGPKAAWLN